MRCAHTVGNVTIIDAIVVPSSAYTLPGRCKLEGDVDVGSAPATYLPPAICANCVDQRIFGTVWPRLSVSVVGGIAPGRFSMSCSDWSTQKLGRMHEWYMIQLNCGQSVAAFTMSSGLPNSGVLLGPPGCDPEGERPLWMQMLKKPGCFFSWS